MSSEVRSTDARRWLLPAVTAFLVACLVATMPSAHANPEDEPPVPEHAYLADGEQVTGGASIAQAAPILPGIHRDSFAEGVPAEETEGGTTKYYRIDVQDGQRVHAGITIAAPPYPDGLPDVPDSLNVALSFLTSTGEDCTNERNVGIGESNSADGPVTSTAVSRTVGPDGCRGDALYLAVERRGSRVVDQPLPVEIQVAIQPSGVGGSSPSVTEPLEDEGASPVSPRSEDPLALGRSFATAKPVEPGSYVVDLAPGQTGLLAIDVREGQRLRWRTEVTSSSEQLDQREISLLVFNAARSQVTVAGGSFRASASDGVRGGGMVAPVELGNRASDTDRIASAWLPGRHTILLHGLQQRSDLETGDQDPVRLILTLEVDGEELEGAADGTVLELGDVTGSSWGSWGIGRIALLAGGMGLGGFGLVTGVAGVLVLRLRR